MRLCKDKDVNAIRRIQATFDCCRFNTVIDRAWPFPHGRSDENNGADQCERIYRHDRPYVGPWRQAEQINAVVCFKLAIAVFICRSNYSITFLMAYHPDIPPLLTIVKGYSPHPPAQQCGAHPARWLGPRGNA
jgi:hypothetical protein